MTDLPEFLLARIAEDEAMARVATPGPWSTDEHADRTEPHWAVEGPTPDGERWPLTVVEVSSDRDYGNPEGGCERREDAEHIARHDPVRVLADCAAKRRIVEADAGRRAHNDEASRSRLVFWGGGIVEVNGERMSTQEFDARFTEPAEPSWHIRLLALPYADHPDYDEAWRP